MRYNIPMQSKGMIYIFTGDGKGKTSAALGSAIRALAAGLKVAIIQWYKDPDWKISDHDISTLLNKEAQKRFTLLALGQGFYIKTKTAPLTTGQMVIDKTTPKHHKQAATQALTEARRFISKVDVLILDEINNAIADQLINLEEIQNLLNSRGSTHIILTGRNAHPALIERADLVTSMNKIKHPYDQGKLAIKGLDY
jgi:cob(I)alamin adenosyltransferase